ncbi:SpaH/EbpB family LPXTG-anchored major pilin [Pseudoscardovia suis]|uniref:Cell wall anchor protein n=1 Tax=Pseudoscardovia suis TaxID=987063 RepID=A0A261F2W3_9BIFI|nr:SpaH/EbpB family LPXTG-anchored major pilin [Pseudoscardovia suis]OZG53438.1 cell wall anchor protein [Pseudoscardovia suis]PJJ68941.1 LPXTG-motif cell wall-anchored protein/fimbrial isopeptide formation D2 family protein [Pseudoscardovia suis]
MSVLAKNKSCRVAVAILSILGMLAAVVALAPQRAIADSSTGASITLQSSDSLANRTFQAWEPIRISSQSSDGSLTVDITDEYLPYVRTAAANLNLPIDKDTTNDRNVTATSSEDDVVEAVSHLAQRQHDGSSDEEARSFAKELQTVLVDNKVAPTKTNDDFVPQSSGARKLSGLDYGWYLIQETTGDNPALPSAQADNSPVSLVMTTPVTGGDVPVTVKSKTPESHKNIVEADHSQQRKAAVVNQNEPIHYQLTFYVPAQWSSQYADKGFWFTMNDTLDSSLVFDHADAIQIGDAFDSTTSDVDFSAANGLYDTSLAPTTTTADGKTLTWAFGDDTGTNLTANVANKALAGKWVKLYYTAHLSQDAPINTAIGNAYDVTYQHSPYSTTGGEKTPTEHPYVYTMNLQVDKIDGSNSAELSGVEFQVYSDEECTKLVKFSSNGSAYEYDPNGAVTTLVTGEDGKINVEGVAGSADGVTYYLKETKAAAGYRALNSAIAVTVSVQGFSDQADLVRTDGTTQTLTYSLAKQGGNTSVSNGVLVVKNYRGLLPSTGAAGIILFAVVGVLLIGGGALMLRRTKKQ